MDLAGNWPGLFSSRTSSLSWSVFPIHLAHRVSPTQKTDPVDASVLRESALLDARNRIHSPGGESVYRAKICPGHSDGKMFECGKFLKHSLQQGYIAGLGRDVGKALVNDTPRGQLLQAKIICAHDTTFKLIRGRGGRASFQKWSSFRTAKWERCGSMTGGFCRWNGWSSASSKVWRNRLAIFSSDDILALHSPIRLAVL